MKKMNGSLGVMALSITIGIHSSSAGAHSPAEGHHGGGSRGAIEHPGGRGGYQTGGYHGGGNQRGGGYYGGHEGSIRHVETEHRGAGRAEYGHSREQGAVRGPIHHQNERAFSHHPIERTPHINEMHHGYGRVNPAVAYPRHEYMDHGNYRRGVYDGWGTYRNNNTWFYGSMFGAAFSIALFSPLWYDNQPYAFYSGYGFPGPYNYSVMVTDYPVYLGYPLYPIPPLMFIEDEPPALYETWVRAKNGQVPRHAVVNSRSHGKATFTCRATYMGQLNYGVLVAGDGCYIEKKSVTMRFTQYEVLVLL